MGVCSWQLDHINVMFAIWKVSTTNLYLLSTMQTNWPVTNENRPYQSRSLSYVTFSVWFALFNYCLFILHHLLIGWTWLFSGEIVSVLMDFQQNVCFVIKIILVFLSKILVYFVCYDRSDNNILQTSLPIYIYVYNIYYKPQY